MSQTHVTASSGLSDRDAADRPEVAVFCAFLTAFVHRDEAREELGAALAALVRLAKRTRTDGITLMRAIHLVGCPSVDASDPSRSQQSARYEWAMGELMRELGRLR